MSKGTIASISRLARTEIRLSYRIGAGLVDRDAFPSRWDQLSHKESGMPEGLARRAMRPHIAHKAHAALTVWRPE